MLCTKCQVVKYLLATHEKREVIAEGEAKTRNFKKPEHMYAARYPEIIWEKYYVVVIFMKKQVLRELLLKDYMSPSVSQ